MPIFSQYASEVYHRCDELAKFSQSKGQINRQYLTREHAKANEQVAKWMQQAGMKSWIDEAGNVWGRYESNDQSAKSFIMGSHLDSVPDAGKYDGILGVIAPISLIRYFHQHGITFPYHIDVVGFCDEEGSRFGTTLLGSRAITGTWQDKWATLTDKNGVNLASAMREFGLNINNIHKAQRSSKDYLGFLELHIEQGPVLEANSHALGFVTAISGAKRFVITVQGESGHAGTVPMAMRKDALVSSCEMIGVINQIANKYDIVATVGEIHNTPNAVNVISGKCMFTLDIRSQDDSARDEALSEIKTKLKDLSKQNHTPIEFKKTHHADAVSCHPDLTDKVKQALISAGLPPFGLASGAGHDAMEMAKLCPMSMLFMRCHKGISHHPDEAIDAEDITKSLEVLYAFFNAYKPD